MFSLRSYRSAEINTKNRGFTTMQRECNLDLYIDFQIIFHKSVIPQIEDILFDKYKHEWQTRILSQNLGEKLKTYNVFKNVFEIVMYLSKAILDIEVLLQYLGAVLSPSEQRQVIMTKGSE